MQLPHSSQMIFLCGRWTRNRKAMHSQLLILSFHASHSDTISDSEDIEVWDGDGDEDLPEDVSAPDSSPSFGSPDKDKVHAILVWIITFLLKIQARYYIPDACINLLVKFFFTFISIAGGFSTFMKASFQSLYSPYLC